MYPRSSIAVKTGGEVVDRRLLGPMRLLPVSWRAKLGIGGDGVLWLTHARLRLLCLMKCGLMRHKSLGARQ